MLRHTGLWLADNQSRDLNNELWLVAGPVTNLNGSSISDSFIRIDSLYKFLFEIILYQFLHLGVDVSYNSFIKDIMYLKDISRCVFNYTPHVAATYTYIVSLIKIFFI